MGLRQRLRMDAVSDRLLNGRASPCLIKLGSSISDNSNRLPSGALNALLSTIAP